MKKCFKSLFTTQNFQQVPYLSLVPEQSSVLSDLELDPDQRNSFENNPTLNVAVFTVVENINFLQMEKMIMPKQIIFTCFIFTREKNNTSVQVEGWRASPSQYWLGEIQSLVTMRDNTFSTQGQTQFRPNHLYKSVPPSACISRTCSKRGNSRYIRII